MASQPLRHALIAIAAVMLVTTALAPTTEASHNGFWGEVVWTWFIYDSGMRQLSDSGVLRIDFSCDGNTCHGEFWFQGAEGYMRCTLTSNGIWSGEINILGLHQDGCTDGSWSTGHEIVGCRGTASGSGSYTAGSGGGYGLCHPPN